MKGISAILRADKHLNNWPGGTGRGEKKMETSLVFFLKSLKAGGRGRLVGGRGAV